jgi:hypothetical protein
MPACRSSETPWVWCSPKVVCITRRLRRDLPCGTITFLVTDLEGSTKLL